MLILLICKWISLFIHTVVVEKTSPPVPVEVGPDTSTSSANQVMAPTQVSGMTIHFPRKIHWNLVHGQDSVCDSLFCVYKMGKVTLRNSSHQLPVFFLKLF